MISARLSDIARPFLWLAAIGFAVGFLSYLLLGGGAQALGPPATPVVNPLSLAQDLPRDI